ncbi:hypothetical protein [Lysinibacillus cavernae]|uniref:hypothetical protein n=1 Tax=Lysinibacillus cavernae TaxID=2666135 RepID=UPI0012D8A565|nr:hypothetical protein [Lysinibacillus cavernae]
MKKNYVLIDEIMQHASQVPFECQEKILDILRGMAFTKKCLKKEIAHIGENKELDENQHSK